MKISRRSVLHISGLAAAALALTGCSAAGSAALGGKLPDLQLCSDRLNSRLMREENRKRLLTDGCIVAFDGWIPAARLPRLTSWLDTLDCAYDVSNPTAEEIPDVPVQLRGNVLTRSMNCITEQYSMPAYDGVDPNPIMAPFFIFFFGMMMADMGYGLLMMIASVIISKKYRPKGTSGELFSLLGLCGISTFIMGALTGGFFGDFLTQLVAIVSPGTVFALPKLFDPLDDLTMILIGSMALGIVQIVTGMAISLIEKCKRCGGAVCRMRAGAARPHRAGQRLGQAHGRVRLTL